MASSLDFLLLALKTKEHDSHIFFCFNSSSTLQCTMTMIVPEKGQKVPVSSDFIYTRHPFEKSLFPSVYYNHFKK